MAPWADMLYICDPKFWDTYPDALKFEGLKVCQDANFCKRHPDVEHIELRPVLEFVDEPDVVGSGKNGGFQAFNLVTVNCGVKKVLLLGFDMHQNGRTHFHGPHPKPLGNPFDHTFRLWIQAFKDARPKIEKMNIEVVNCTPGSALDCFAKMSLCEALKA